MKDHKEKNSILKKIFGGINLTWKRLIIFAIIAGVYTAIMAMLPITENTSFRDIAIQFECWILFGILIACNSKSPKDSALKCFVFFLISQPLVYLIQVPFSSLGWGLFGYYKYWFLWTLLCLPMGYIGYYIKKNNIVSALLLSLAFIFLAFLGLLYLNQVITNFPHHLLSTIFCFAVIIIVALSLLDKAKLRAIALGITAAFTVIYVVLTGGDLTNSRYEIESYWNLDDCSLSGETMLISYVGTDVGNTELIKENGTYIVKLNGRKGGNYTFSVADENEKTCSYRYYYDKNKDTIILEKTN